MRLVRGRILIILVARAVRLIGSVRFRTRATRDKTRTVRSVTILPEPLDRRRRDIGADRIRPGHGHHSVEPGTRLPDEIAVRRRLIQHEISVLVEGEALVDPITVSVDPLPRVGRIAPIIIYVPEPRRVCPPLARKRRRGQKHRAEQHRGTRGQYGHHSRFRNSSESLELTHKPSPRRYR